MVNQFGGALSLFLYDEMAPSWQRDLQRILSSSLLRDFVLVAVTTENRASQKVSFWSICSFCVDRWLPILAVKNVLESFNCKIFEEWYMCICILVCTCNFP